MWRLADPTEYVLAAIMNFLSCAIDSTGHAFWPLCRASLIKNYYCEMNIWQPRTASSGPSCRAGSGCRMRSGPPWPRSPNDSDRKALKDIARVAKPDTLLGWYRRLLAQKFDGSRNRAYPGRPRASLEVETLVVRLARENRGWGYDRMVGALANLGYQVSDQTVGYILRRHNIAPAPERSRTTTWKEFIRSHRSVLAGADFFTVEVLTWRGLVTYYVLFFIEVGSRRVRVGGITRHPESSWMQQVARNATMEGAGYLNGCRYLLHDRDRKFCQEFRDTLASGGVECTPIPPRSPNLNAHAERWVRSIKEECLSKLILFGEHSLQRVVSNFLEHYHQERNHQGKDNLLLFPVSALQDRDSPRAIRCRERLGGLLKYYGRVA